MNLLKRKLPLFCISNIMASLVSVNIASATYTYKEEQNAIVYSQMEAETEELEPVSQNGDGEEIKVAEEAPPENIVVQREVTGTRNYVPARYSEVTGQAVVDYAKRYLGLNYVSGGYSLSTGTDCSGFTKLIYNEFGVYLPRTVSGQMYSGSYVRRDDLRKGDIIVYGNGGGYATHVALYIGDNLVIHESNHRDGVKISNVNMMQYITARRVINDTAISIVEKQIEEAKVAENEEEKEEVVEENEENNSQEQSETTEPNNVVDNSDVPQEETPNPNNDQEVNVPDQKPEELEVPQNDNLEENSNEESEES